jgi:hypothetical protein
MMYSTVNLKDVVGASILSLKNRTMVGNEDAGIHFVISAVLSIVYNHRGMPAGGSGAVVVNLKRCIQPSPYCSS